MNRLPAIARLLTGLALAVLLTSPAPAHASQFPPICEAAGAEGDRLVVPGLSIFLPGFPGLDSVERCALGVGLLPDRTVTGGQIYVPLPHPDVLAGHTVLLSFGSVPLEELYAESPNARGADRQNVSGFLAQRMGRYELGSPNPRFTTLRFEVNPADFLGEQCARLDYVQQDVGVPRFEGQPFLLTATKYYCIHPSRDLVIWAQYSERRPPGVESVPGFDDLMERILSRLELEGN